MASFLPTIKADAEFILDLPLYRTEKPYYIAGPLHPENEKHRTNAVFEDKKVEFHDLRGNENLFSLKDHGFEFTLDSNADIKMLNGLTEETVEMYAKDTVKLVKKLVGTDNCWCYAYKVRPEVH
jgi:hypothetical protein